MFKIKLLSSFFSDYFLSVIFLLKTKKINFLKRKKIFLYQIIKTNHKFHCSDKINNHHNKNSKKK